MATITINSDQLPLTNPAERLMRWNCDEYCIAYDRRTRVLTVEEFEGFDDDNGGEEITRVCAEAEALRVLRQHKPGWPSLDGFTLLLDYYGDGWTIGTTPI